MIQKDELLTIDNSAIPVPDKLSCHLYYYTETGAMLISDFQLVFPEHMALKIELNTLLLEMKNKDQKEKFNEITSYVTEFYGKPDTANLNQWLKSNLAFK